MAHLRGSEGRFEAKRCRRAASSQPGLRLPRIQDDPRRPETSSERARLPTGTSDEGPSEFAVGTGAAHFTRGRRAGA